MKTLLLVLIGLSLSACATAHKMNRLSLGMTKGEVIDQLGNPVSTSAATGVEYMNYELFDNGDKAFLAIPTQYFVRIVNGKVDAYGRTGDFDSTKDRTTKVEIKQTIEADKKN